MTDLLAGFAAFERGTKTVPMRVTLYSTHVQIGVGAWRALGCPERVNWLYDRNQHLVGVRAASGGDGYAIAKGVRNVAAARFFAFYGIHPPAATRVPAAYDAETKMVMFDVTPFVTPDGGA